MSMKMYRALLVCKPCRNQGWRNSVGDVIDRVELLRMPCSKCSESDWEIKHEELFDVV